MAKELSHRDWLQEKVKNLEFSLLCVADITEIREEFYLEEKTFSLFDKAISLGKVGIYFYG